MSGKKDRFTALLSQEGNPGFGLTLSAVLLLAWPAIVEQIMITLVQYVDTAMVGSLGSQATAAVGLTSSTTWLFNGFFAAAAIGFSVQVAQHLGAGRQEDAQKVVWQSLRFTVLFGCPPCWAPSPLSGGTPPCTSGSWPAPCPSPWAPTCSAPSSAAPGTPRPPWSST